MLTCARPPMPPLRTGVCVFCRVAYLVSVTSREVHVVDNLQSAALLSKPVAQGAIGKGGLLRVVYRSVRLLLGHLEDDGAVSSGIGGESSRLQSEQSILNLLVQQPSRCPTRVTAFVLGRCVRRLIFGELDKVRASLDLFPDSVGIGLCGHHDL